MPFEFATATRIIFGVGALSEVGAHAKESGHRALVVTGRDTHRAEPLLAALRRHGVTGLTFSVFGEPELETVGQGIKQARGQRCDMVIGFGGGSALDAGKAIAATFDEISIDIKIGVDYIVTHRQDDKTPAAPSTLIKWEKGQPTVIRE